jgi:hypothetical protein
VFYVLLQRFDFVCVCCCLALFVFVYCTTVTCFISTFLRTGFGSMKCRYGMFVSVCVCASMYVCNVTHTFVQWLQIKLVCIQVTLYFKFTVNIQIRYTFEKKNYIKWSYM